MDTNKRRPIFDLDINGWLRDLAFEDSHYKAIGKLAVKFTALEFFVSYYISVLNNESDIVPGKVITSRLSIAQLLPILGALYRLRDSSPGRNDELSLIIAEIEKLRHRRNNMIHSQWNYDPSANSATRSKTISDPKKILREDIEVLSVHEIDKIGDDLALITFRLQAFMQAWLPPRLSDSESHSAAGG